MLFVATALSSVLSQAAFASQCPAQRVVALVPTDTELCRSLLPAMSDPSALPLEKYQAVVDQFLGNYCHRDEASGWKRDKHVRDTGPFTANFSNGQWAGSYRGTHAPVVIWYSPEMADWLVTNRPGDGEAVENPPAIPDGAMMIKEMFDAPAAACASVEPTQLHPSSGAAIMIKDAKASHDGWFWGWYGFGAGSGWDPDFPPAPSNPMTNMGFAQYCMNCHASAESELTFASARNIEGEPGTPLVFLSQNFFTAPPAEVHHSTVSLPNDDVRRLGQPHYRADNDVVEALRAYTMTLPSWEGVSKMPSETFDHTWVKAGGPDASDQFLTASQCLGCHDAGSTGLQFDMTAPNPHGAGLENQSPYATWRTSPMGLAGRDPVFFAQLASETQTFHPESRELVEDTCLGCHGVSGQRQFHIDSFAQTGQCEPFSREMVKAVPFPEGGEDAHLANYGALARDGISCTTCHRMDLASDPAELLKNPENACVAERQALLNPDNEGFAKTFTGSFPVGAPDKLVGPFADPKVRPMENALGITPVAHSMITSSETCGTCHTVHLPVMSEGKVITHTYEQTTYPEWAFSAYRTGSAPQGDLPQGPGATPQTCQDCHMPSRASDGTPNRSKIASIQEYSNFPQAENVMGPEEIDLEVREGYSPHTLVGLNVFLVKMAQQFPDVLGIRVSDPMLGGRGVDPLVRTEQSMLDMASNNTAEISVSQIEKTERGLKATVSVLNKVGHKFPSGVGFRRAFVEFRVLDQMGDTLWVSGGTNALGAILGPDGKPIDGEYWWEDDCSARVAPLERRHQPHFQTISNQSQAQIYQELVAAPGAGDGKEQCEVGMPSNGPLTTSFLSICTHVKDNRLLPHGFLGLDERKEIAEALGATDVLAVETGPVAINDDPDYVAGGGDEVVYDIALDNLPKGRVPVSVEAKLYYQATPPFYQQDRMCTAKGDDAERLGFLISRLNLKGTQAEGWKLEIASTGAVAVGGKQ
jgi:hypothetical protein